MLDSDLDSDLDSGLDSERDLGSESGSGFQTRQCTGGFRCYRLDCNGIRRSNLPGCWGTHRCRSQFEEWLPTRSERNASNTNRGQIHTEVRGGDTRNKKAEHHDSGRQLTGVPGCSEDRDRGCWSRCTRCLRKHTCWPRSPTSSPEWWPASRCLSSNTSSHLRGRLAHAIASSRRPSSAQRRPDSRTR
jgi:hypothetical protein